LREVSHLAVRKSAKAAFLREAARALEIPSVLVYDGRLESLSPESLGDKLPDLISIRGRATSQRPFTTVEDMRRAAEESFRGKEKELQQKLSDTEKKLAELQTGKSKDQEMILSPEQRAELQRFLDQKVEVRKELRQVRRGLDDKIEALGTRLKLVNIALMPFLITAAALGFAAWKRRRRTL